MSDRPEEPEKSSGSEHARILAEVMEDQARRKEVRDATSEKDRAVSDTSFFVQVGLLVSGTFFFYLLFFSPAWIAPTAPEPIAAEQVDDGLRVAIFLTAKQVEAFQLEEGRLPDNLRELGVQRAGIEYVRVDPRTYRVQASRGDVSLTYDSTQSLAEFAGSALSILGGGETS